MTEIKDLSCKTEGCDYPALKRGYCRRCYGLERKAGNVSYYPSTVKRFCMLCGQPAWARGLCLKHYIRVRHLKRVLIDMMVQAGADMEVTSLGVSLEPEAAVLEREGCAPAVVPLIMKVSRDGSPSVHINRDRMIDAMREVLLNHTKEDDYESDNAGVSGEDRGRVDHYRDATLRLLRCGADSLAGRSKRT